MAAHSRQHRIRRHKIGVLPDAEPRLVAAARFGGLDLAGGRGRAVERERPGHAEPLRRFHDRLAAKLKRKLPKRAVAGICERLLDRLAGRASPCIRPSRREIEILIAGERLFGEIRGVLHRGDERHELEYEPGVNVRACSG